MNVESAMLVVLKKYVKLQEKDSILHFLNGLNESYATMRHHILIMKPFPSLDKGYGLILCEKNHKEAIIH